MLSDKIMHGYQSEIMMKFFMDVHTSGFLIFLISFFKKQNRNVLIFSYILFIIALFCHLSFDKLSRPQNTMTTPMFTRGLWRAR